MFQFFGEYWVYFGVYFRENMFNEICVVGFFDSVSFCVYYSGILELEFKR